MDLRRFLREVRFGTDLPYRLYDRVTFLLRQLGPRHPVRRDTDDARTPPFFIVGSGRSGNTLLRAILTGHGDLAVPPESYVLGPVVRDFRKLAFLPWAGLLRIVLGRFRFHPGFDAWELDAGAVYRKLAECPEEERSLARIVDGLYRSWARQYMSGAGRWGDKTPTNVYHLPRIDAVFPGAAYIHMVRDGRDVVASYLDAGLYESVERACDRWLESVRLVRRFGRGLPPHRYLELRYERLVREPETVSREVCELLGVAFEPPMLEHRERADELGDTDAPHHAGLRRPIDDRSVGSWRERLNGRQQSVVEDRLDEMLSALSYDGR